MVDNVKHFVVTAAWIICGMAALLLFSGATIPDPIVSPLTPKKHTKPSFTTDSEISPDVIMNEWPAVYVSLPNDEGAYMIVAENPLLRTPIDTHIKYVLVCVHIYLHRLLGYSYYIGDKLFIYEFNPETRHYGAVPVIPRKKKTIDSFLFHFLGRDKT